jgi:hypothetical protein
MKLRLTMISLLTIKMSSLQDAQSKASKEIANAHSLGWRVLSQSEHFQNGKYYIVVWITPRNEE